MEDQSLVYISIIVPVYNAEKCLAICIESILLQNYSNFELLLVNDGSIDASGIICDEYSQKDMRIRVFHQKNRGVSVARNVGLMSAIGRFVCFVDADDWVGNTYLSSFISANGFPFGGISVQGYREVYNNDDTWVDFKYKKSYADSLNGIATLFSEVPIIQSTGPVSKLFDLEIIKNNNVRFDEKLSFGEDTIFYYTYLYFISNCYVSDNVGYFYRKFWSDESLIMRTHSFDYYWNFGNVLFQKMQLLLDKYAMPLNVNYFSVTYSYSLYLIYRAMYKSAICYCERLGVLKKINSWSFSNCKITKIILLKRIISKFPYKLQDLVLMLVFSVKK